jgi:DNA-binding MarR family transcriptional regulator
MHCFRQRRVPDCLAQLVRVPLYLVLKRDPQEFYERLGAVLRCVRGVTADACAAIDIGTTQAKFLRQIGDSSHISQVQLARATNTAPTLTGRVLGSLVERGWVRRKRSKEDRRQYVLELTASGTRMRERVETARNGVIQSLASVLDENDAENFDRIAAKILAAFGRSGTGGSPRPGSSGGSQ